MNSKFSEFVADPLNNSISRNVGGQYYMILSPTSAPTSSFAIEIRSETDVVLPWGNRAIRLTDQYTLEECEVAWCSNGKGDTFDEWLIENKPAVLYDPEWHLYIQNK